MDGRLGDPGNCRSSVLCPLERVVRQQAFDRFVEGECREFYASKMGRPSLTPGIYFRLLLLGYFGGIDSEGGIAWRAEDSLSIRRFLGIGLDEPTPDHSTILRTRRLIDVETHKSVFGWVLQVAATEGLVKGNTIGVDATTLEANAAMRSIVRRENGETNEEFLKKLAKEAGIETPAREQLAKMDRKRKKKMSNEAWTNPNDLDARTGSGKAQVGREESRAGSGVRKSAADSGSTGQTVIEATWGEG